MLKHTNYIILFFCFISIAYAEGQQSNIYNNLTSVFFEVRTSRGGVYFSDCEALSITFLSDTTSNLYRVLINSDSDSGIMLNFEELIQLQNAVDSCKIEIVSNNCYYLVFSVVYNLSISWKSAVSYICFPEDSDIFYSILEENWSKEKIDKLRSFINNERKKAAGHPSILLKDKTK